MKIFRYLVIIFCAIALFAFPGCKKKEGPAEQAGKKVDQAVESVKEAAQQAGEKVEKTVEEAKK